MARIRSIKPGFCKDKVLAALPLEVRLHYAMLWTYCDDEGRGQDDVRLIKGELWTLDDDVTHEVIEDWQNQLHLAGRIQRYTEDEDYFAVVHWAEHQKPQHPKDSEYPPPTAENLREAVPIDRRSRSERPEQSGEAAPESTPVVVVGVGEEREFSSSSSSDSTGEPAGPDDDDGRIHKASQIIAARKYDQRPTHLPSVAMQDSWISTTAKNCRREVASCAANHPELDALGIADALEPLERPADPKSEPPEAARRDYDRPPRCTNPECVGGNVETDAGCVPCPACNRDSAWAPA